MENLNNVKNEDQNKKVMVCIGGVWMTREESLEWDFD